MRVTSGAGADAMSAGRNSERSLQDASDRSSVRSVGTTHYYDAEAQQHGGSLGGFGILLRPGISGGGGGGSGSSSTTSSSSNSSSSSNRLLAGG